MPILTVYARLTAMALRWARSSNDFIYIFNIVKNCLIVNSSIKNYSVSDTFNIHIINLISHYI